MVKVTVKVIFFLWSINIHPDNTSELFVTELGMIIYHNEFVSCKKNYFAIFRVGSQ